MTTMTTNSSSSPAMSVFWENVRTILYALALAMAIRFTIAQPFRIPSGSMLPTLEIGDYIVVTKWSFGYSRYSFAPLERVLPHGRLFGSMPEQGDVVVFRPTHEPNRDFIKRVIGLPGDRVQVRDGQLIINGEPTQREFIGVEQMLSARGEMVDGQVFRETLPNGVSFIIYEAMGQRGGLDNTEVFTVPEGNFFMMGDNRDNSDDSRGQVGFVPAENLVGPAQFVITSFDETTSIFRPWTLFTGFRAERFLKPVE